MEKECKYIKNLKQKNKYYKKIILTIIIIIAIIVLITIHWEQLKYLFYNDNGNFSNDILWSFLGAIGSILAVIGVIATIIYTEYSRKEQNEYEFYRQQLLEEHIEFKKEVKKQLEILDPIRIIVETKNNQNNEDKNKNNGQTYMDRLNDYRVEIKSIDYKVYWYYNKTMQGNYIQLNSFMSELNTFREYIEERIKEYYLCIEKYMKFEFYEIYLKIEKNGLMNENDKNNFKKIKEENPTLIEDICRVQDEIYEIKKKIVEYRNERWFNIVEKAKVMIEERENIIKEKLEGKYGERKASNFPL